MKIKLDENIPVSLVSTLRRMGRDVVTVHDEGLGGQEHDIVWEACQQEGRFFVTQDLDFSDIDKFRPGRHWVSFSCACVTLDEMLLPTRLLRFFS